MALLSLAGLGVGFGIGGWPWLLFGYGGMGIWALIDFITLILGAFRDKEGRLLVVLQPSLTHEGHQPSRRLVPFVVSGVTSAALDFAVLPMQYSSRNK